MSESLTEDKYSIREYRDLNLRNKGNEELQESESTSNFSKDGAVKLMFSHSELSAGLEDSKGFLTDLLGSRDAFIKEKWDITENVQGKIVSVSETEVYIDCLVDIEQRSFQHRAFPIYLFKTLPSIESNKFVIIKTNMKAGSVRVDVHPGEGIVSPKLFELKDKWESLKDAGLDEKLTEW